MIEKTKSFLEARDLSIRFPIQSAVKGETNSALGGQMLTVGRRSYVSALEQVSFRLEAGDSLGLIGHNGSGKSTLLRTLAGILPPTSGEVTYGGTLGNAININIGFRPEVSGRNNIKLKAIIAGRRRAEFDRLIDDVESFAELGPYLDMPMRTYSQGMRARLAFGVATAFRYDILLLDEWLGAGDKQMQDRAAVRMAKYVEQANIAVLASHRSPLLKKWCNKGLVMEKGRAVFFGHINDALNVYENMSVDK